MVNLYKAEANNDRIARADRLEAEDRRLSQKLATEILRM